MEPLNSVETPRKRRIKIYIQVYVKKYILYSGLRTTGLDRGNLLNRVLKLQGSEEASIKTSLPLSAAPKGQLSCLVFTYLRVHTLGAHKHQRKANLPGVRY